MPTSAQKKLKLKSDNSALGITTEEWQNTLKSAAPDPVAGIRHAAIKGDESFRFHVAAIPSQVNCHVHFHKVMAGSNPVV